MNYKSLSEKRVFFEQEIINDISCLNNRINQLQGNYIFRGVKESKYKMQTSLQRYSEGKQITMAEMYSKLKVAIEEINCCPEVQSYFSQRKCGGDIVSTLSLMQDYGLPTPLLDWSLDITSALWFALDGIEIGNIDFQNIESYVSLYYIDLSKNNEFAGCNVQSIYGDAMDILNSIDLEEEERNIQKCNPNCKFTINDSIRKDINELVSLDDLLIMGLVAVMHPRKAREVINLSGQRLSIENPNQEIQSGCFSVNTSNLPLEEFWEMHRIGNAPGIKNKTKINCIEIRKDILQAWWKQKGRNDFYDDSEQSIRIQDCMNRVKKSLFVSQ